MIRVQISGIEATIENYEWSCENKYLEGALNAMLDPLGPSGADPYPDLTAAQQAIELLGGEIVEYDKPTDYPKDTVF